LAHLQCATPCSDEIWSADELEVMVDEESFRAVSELPKCPRCGSLARPNVLMFNDWHWIPRRTSAQQRRFDSWLADVINAKTVIVELGAGSAVPSVRLTSEHAAARLGATLVRINPREPQVPHGQIGIPRGALEALEAMDQLL
jgi:NAD-dependent SIR2 family protein deacetylase